MDFAGFSKVEFTAKTKEEGFVYVFCYVRASGEERPFYVGETGRFDGRMRDYNFASFAACTDFAVGEAAKYLRDKKGCCILVYYRPSEDRKREEKEIIQQLEGEKWPLRNSLERYAYETANKEDELRKNTRFLRPTPSALTRRIRTLSW